MPTPKLIILTNADPIENLPELANAMPIGAMTAALPDGEAPEWVEVPYADVFNDAAKIPGLQRLNKAVADRMVHTWNSLRQRIARFVDGVPWYAGGHPDMRQGEEPEAVAWLKNIEAGETGLRLRVEWGAEGLRLLANKAFRFFSPVFLGEEVSRENGAPVYEPRFIQSVGLTNRPRWPVAPLVNAIDGPDAVPSQENTMTLLQRLLALIGKEAVTTEDDVVNYVQNLIEAVKAIRKSLQERWKAEDAAYQAVENCESIDAAVVEALKQIDVELAELPNRDVFDDLKLQVVRLADARLSERKGRAMMLVNAAMDKGSVIEAERESRLAELVNAENFDVAAAALAALPPRMKTETTVSDLGRRDVAIRDHVKHGVALVNAYMDEHNCDYDTAFAAVRPQIEQKPAE